MLAVLTTNDDVYTMRRYSRNILQWNKNNIKSTRMTTGDYFQACLNIFLSCILESDLFDFEINFWNKKWFLLLLTEGVVYNCFFCGNRSSTNAQAWHHFACSFKKKDVGYCGRLLGVRGSALFTPEGDIWYDSIWRFI